MSQPAAPDPARRPGPPRRTVLASARGWDGDWRGAVVIVTHRRNRADWRDLTLCLHRHQLVRAARRCAERLARQPDVHAAILRELVRP